MTTSTEVVVACLVRDGSDYIDTFIRHYEALGVTKFVFMDNGSVDNTVELLTAVPQNVILLSTKAPYKYYKYAMKRYLAKMAARGNWVLCVDIDELFDFPYRNGRSIVTLTEYLEKHDYNAVVAHMLDMFPGIQPPQGEWVNIHNHYTTSGITRYKYTDICREGNIVDLSLIEFYGGGIRDIKFNIQPYLTKHPLICPKKGADFYHHHKIRGGNIADFTCVLLHYKFVGDLQRRFSAAAAEGNYDNDSAEYKIYLSELNKGFKIDEPSARILNAIDELLDDCFVVTSTRFQKHFATAP